MSPPTDMPGWLERQRSHFEAGALRYARMYGGSTPFHEAMTRRLLDMAEVRPGMRVLDLGCGAGRTTVPLLQAGCQVVGLDLSATSLALLGERLEELDLAEGFEGRVGAAEDLTERRVYDRVIARGLVHHLESPAPVLAKVRQALRPGGRLTLMDPNPGQPAWIALVTLHPALSWPIERHLFRHTARANRAMLAAAGFVQVETDYLGLIPPPAWEWPLPWGGLEDRLRKVPGLRRLCLYLVSRATRPMS